LSYIYDISGDKTDAMVADGLEAVAGARMMQQKVLQVKDRLEKNHQDFDGLIAALDYEINLFQMECRPSYGGWNADASFYSFLWIRFALSLQSNICYWRFDK